MPLKTVALLDCLTSRQTDACPRITVYSGLLCLNQIRKIEIMLVTMSWFEAPVYTVDLDGEISREACIYAATSLIGDPLGRCRREKRCRWL
jgi:hypothetical protein